MSAAEGEVTGERMGLKVTPEIIEKMGTKHALQPVTQNEVGETVEFDDATRVFMLEGVKGLRNEEGLLIDVPSGDCTACANLLLLSENSRLSLLEIYTHLTGINPVTTITEQRIAKSAITALENAMRNSGIEPFFRVLDKFVERTSGIQIVDRRFEWLDRSPASRYLPASQFVVREAVAGDAKIEQDQKEQDDDSDYEIEDLPTFELRELLGPLFTIETKQSEIIQEMEPDYVYSLFPELVIGSQENAETISPETEIDTCEYAEEVVTAIIGEQELPFSELLGAQLETTGSLEEKTEHIILKDGGLSQENELEGEEKELQAQTRIVTWKDIVKLGPSARELLFLLATSNAKTFKRGAILEQGYRRGVDESKRVSSLATSRMRLSGLIDIVPVVGRGRNSVHEIKPFVIEGVDHSNLTLEVLEEIFTAKQKEFKTSSETEPSKIRIISQEEIDTLPLVARELLFTLATMVADGIIHFNRKDILATSFHREANEDARKAYVAGGLKRLAPLLGIVAQEERALRTYTVEPFVLISEAQRANAVSHKNQPDLRQAQVDWLRGYGEKNKNWLTTTDIILAGFPLDKPIDQTDKNAVLRAAIKIREAMHQVGWISNESYGRWMRYHSPPAEGELISGSPVLLSKDDGVAPPKPATSLLPQNQRIQEKPTSSSSRQQQSRGSMRARSVVLAESDGSAGPKRRDDVREDEDLVKLYLTEIGKHPLLNGKEEERELAQAIEAGKAAIRKLDEASADLTITQKRELRRIASEGEEAEKKFVRSNLRLVVSIAKRYQASGLPLLDLIQEGNIGLMHSIEKFDWRKGFKFSTYSTWWIRQAITRGIANTGRTIRLPVHAGDDLARIQKARARLEMEFGRRATLSEIAKAAELPEDKVTEALRFASEPLSLSQQLREDGDAELGDIVADKHAISPEEEANRNMLPHIISKILDRLEPREQEIIRLRFGLNDGQARTLEEVGEHFNVTRERVRQIEFRVLSKLRHPSVADMLEGLL